ncbi:hypothetical protein LEN26_008055 [Aphanomyces euteiches]|nr:hypothetical protein AeMF1_000096 [Aphanomyces euteiches]KAH9130951.1 hypothetical protein LEN26_008055 [Aphanomyces euteiches]
MMFTLKFSSQRYRKAVPEVSICCACGRQNVVIETNSRQCVISPRNESTVHGNILHTNSELIFQFNTSKQIVVVGGGYIGIQFAQQLAQQVPSSLAAIIVVEKNDFTFHCIGVSRARVDPSYVKNLFVPLTHALPYPHAKIIRGIADRIETDHLVARSIVHDQVDTTVYVPFDYLVLATGSSYAPPIKVPNDQYTRETVEKAITDTANHIRAASSVLIIGGGPVGVEAATEIAHAYPSNRDDPGSQSPTPPQLSPQGRIS